MPNQQGLTPKPVAVPHVAMGFNVVVSMEARSQRLGQRREQDLASLLHKWVQNYAQYMHVGGGGDREERPAVGESRATAMPGRGWRALSPQSCARTWEVSQHRNLP